MESFEVGLDAFYLLIYLQAYGGQGTKCGVLNENDPHARIYLNV